MLSKTKLKIAISMLILIVLFITVSVIVQNNTEFFISLVKSHYYLGIFIFIAIDILSIVIAPITSLPLLPLASNTYGPFITSIMYIVGGFIGSIIAFIIGRKFKEKFLKNLVSLEEVKLVEKAIPKKHYFLTLILMRIVIPADVLSYTLGLVTNVNFRIFALTTIIGTIPSSIFFSYLGVLPWPLQILGWLFGTIVLIGFLAILFKKKRRKKL